MPRRETNIYPRTTAKGERRYDVMLTYRDRETGQRKQKMKTFATLKAAKDALAVNRASVARGDDAPPTQMTVNDLVREWLAAHKPHIKPTSYEMYENTVNRHIVPQLGHLRLTALTARRLEQHYAQLREEGLGPYAVEKTHQRMVQILQYARRMRLVRANEALDATPPPHVKQEMRIWDDAQIAAFLSVADQSRYGPVWMVALTTGLRRGELLGLRWRDIDYERALLTVAQSRTTVRAGLITQSPKGGRSRTISVAPSVLVLLREHKRRQAQWRLRAGALWVESDLVFTCARGTSIQPKQLSRELARLADLAGVPRLRVHDLRHTHASYLLRHGRSVREVSERLGHASTTMTLNVYAHAVVDEHRETAQMMERLLAMP